MTALKVKSTLNSNPPAFIKKLGKQSRPSSYMRAFKGDRRKGFFQIEPDMATKMLLPALSELELKLLAMAHSGIKKVAGDCFVTIKTRSGPQGGINSDSLSKSWRMRLYRLQALRAVIFGPGSQQVLIKPVGTMLFGYGIGVTDERFVKPIPMKKGTTDLLEILEYGSRPHIIRPRKKGGRLRFEWSKANPKLPIEGTTTFLGFFNQFVRHPGTRPYGFTRIAVAQAGGGMIEVLTKLKIAQFKIVGSK